MDYYVLLQLIAEKNALRLIDQESCKFGMDLVEKDWRQVQDPSEAWIIHITLIEQFLNMCYLHLRQMMVFRKR